MGCTAHPPAFACPGAPIMAASAQSYDQLLVFDLPVVLGTPFRLQFSAGAPP